jgi:NAD(P)-dependent dehydrogenase (short-subunit alcohol dehydrogenase family)
MKHYLDKLQTDKTSATAISPAIRMLAADDEGFPVVVYDESIKSLSISEVEAKLKSANINFSILKFNEDVEETYTSLRKVFADTDDLKAIAIENLGLFVIGRSKSDADYALQCITSGKQYEIDAQKCLVTCGRLSGKVAIVTGSAQGFGEGIAMEMVSEGAYMVIADLNLELANTVADSINERYGFKTAIAVSVNVGDEDSVRNMVEETVAGFGGLDIFVSNAGVLKAGGLEEMTLQSFEFVTKVNYTAFYLCTRYASRPMKIQSHINDENWSDIIQINSKSGLEGSNKNFAYAGGKFGGIGLTQSFALELVTDNIKVNSICPGNFYEGPLWSDPEKGLFVQYLKAGKVPGAKTVADVKDFYLAKSPIRRGCSPLDVTRTIFYCVEQCYETGQAIPVTGGQKMLN